ncbi:MAG TPA: hypothetical protein VI278_13375, partial [Nitrososphaeraceae archaeon]
QTVPTESVNGDNDDNVNNQWIIAMKIIADVCSSAKNSNNTTTNSYVFSQSQLCDFVTLSAKCIDERRMKTEIVSNATLKIYGDIMENYQTFNHSLISNYPSIIIDVISTINKVMNTKGDTVSSISINKYYQSRKQQATISAEENDVPGPVLTTTTTSIAAAAAAAIHKDKIVLSSNSKEELIEIISHITNRKRNDLEDALGRLQNKDLKRIYELCHNYSRLQNYSKLITEGSEQQEFRQEVERELGRKLGPHQLWRAANSVKRVRTYMENILDNKFIPDISHGINHVKHNLEYGYQLICLIERTRSRRQKTQ